MSSEISNEKRFEIDYFHLREIRNTSIELLQYSKFYFKKFGKKSLALEQLTVLFGCREVESNSVCQ